MLNFFFFFSFFIFIKKLRGPGCSGTLRYTCICLQNAEISSGNCQARLPSVYFHKLFWGTHFFYCFLETESLYSVSLCNKPGCPGAHYVDQADINSQTHMDSPAFTSWVLELKEWTTVASLGWSFLECFLLVCFSHHWP